MSDTETLDDLLDQLDALDEADNAKLVGTSVKLPAGLRKAAETARALGMIQSTSELAGESVRSRLEVLAQRTVLDRHYEQFPDARPGLADIAQAYAEIHDHPLAVHPDLIVEAAERVIAIEPDADARDVLLYATALLAEREHAA